MTIIQLCRQAMRTSVMEYKVLKIQNVFIPELSFGQLLREMTCFLCLTKKKN